MKSGALKVTLVFCFTSMAATAFAQQQSPTPRKTMSPLDQSKVSVVQAKRWVNFGANEQIDNVQQIQQQRGMNGPIGSKACITNIGTTTQPNGASGFTPRYGPASTDPNKGRIVVVKGDVINVCK